MDFLYVRVFVSESSGCLVLTRSHNTAMAPVVLLSSRGRQLQGRSTTRYVYMFIDLTDPLDLTLRLPKQAGDIGYIPASTGN